VDSLARATVKLVRAHQLDFVKLQIRASSFAEAFGAGWRYSGSAEEEPVLETSPGLDPGAWDRVADGPSNPAALADQVEVLRRVVAELGEETPVIQTVFSPGMVAWFLAGRGTDGFLKLIVDEPEVMGAALDAIARALAEFTRDSLAAGAAGVFYAINPFADTTVVAPDAYRRTFLPSDRVAVAAAGVAWFNMLHLCGGHIDPDLAGELRTHCLNWSVDDPGNPGLADVRDRLHVAVAGGVQRHAPIRDGEAGIRGAAQAALAATGGRGHLLTPGCSASPWSRVRPENLAALRQAAAG
jgi:uroporphyrinogen decarboxylase